MNSQNLPPLTAQLPPSVLADFLDQSKKPMRLPTGIAPSFPGATS